MSEKLNEEVEGIIGTRIDAMSEDTLNALREKLTVAKACVHAKLGKCLPTKFTLSSARVTKVTDQLEVACEKHAKLILVTRKTRFVSATQLLDEVKAEISRRAQLAYEKSMARHEMMEEARRYVAFVIVDGNEAMIDSVTAERIDAWINANRREYEILLAEIRGQEAKHAPQRDPTRPPAYAQAPAGGINKPRMTAAG